MDKRDTKKAKNRKTSARPKSSKKSTDGPACSMFLVELSRKLAQKKREEQDEPKNIVASILESLTSAIPIILRKASPSRGPSPVKIETLQTLAPELQPNDVIDIPVSITSTDQDRERIDFHAWQERKKKFKMPKMPVITSEVFKQQITVTTEDVAVNTSSSHDMASHLAKYVDTLKKISLIAEEFNQKTAKNLKEIVDSVQEDLQVKLQELKAEQKLTKVDQPLQVAQEDIDQAGASQ